MLSGPRDYHGFYKKKIDRIEVGYRGEYGDEMCVEISCVDGWNESCPTLTHRMSLEEVHDLRYLLDRMLLVAEKS